MRTYQQCIKKARYRSEYEADRVARRCMAERPERYLRAYWCGICNGFHLTSGELMEHNLANERK